jgi:hypothetical protein
MVAITVPALRRPWTIELDWEAGMTRSTLNLDLRRTVEIIEALRFGVIERLSIRDGVPCYEPEPHVIESIKLDSETPEPSNCDDADLTLKKEFVSLFNHLSRLSDCIVNIEVRHGAPFKLEVVRRYTELGR